MPTDVPINELRVLVDDRGQLRKLVRVGWTKRDASFYIIPYATADRRGWVGTAKVGGTSTTIDFTTGIEGPRPKVSVHESGLTHATVEGYRTPDVVGPPLRDDAGGHVATAITFNPTGLPVLTGPPRDAPRADFVLTSESAGDYWWDGMHVPIFVYTQRERAAEKKAYITFMRDGYSSPLYVAFGAVGSEHEPDNREPGVAVLAGWGPGEGSVDEVVYAVTK